MFNSLKECIQDGNRWAIKVQCGSFDIYKIKSKHLCSLCESELEYKYFHNVFSIDYEDLKKKYNYEFECRIIR